MTFYQVIKGTVWQLLNPMYRFDIEGLEHFPKEGGVLICANHISALDPPVVGITSPRPVHFMAKEELFHMPVLKWAIPKLNAFPVKRGMSDRDALRKAISLLKSGEVMGLFPEGTRSIDGKLGKGFSGAGFFAMKGDAHVIPCAIIGPYKPFKRLKVRYGKPIDLTELKERKANAEEVTAVIMEHIQTLLDK
ncbi:lysophospholipid acyltransferase family protein [Paenisporosarcina cavernae]|uniref:1-acyl-sn-glycerol-3-phosphate acyltransferase n=1 Tax=Paenisporosarcina cavernae TaxID=2320858 RepID=A0A385YRZ7_9BACL|nr:lysophospholipid acyltransferase family protein [Paenisporosarcina cavernae]AYC29376.1 1-acyl-sn-glycerol-3-phosphate acyltransferase [Paenisporosarcina cavernae]